MMSVLEVKDIKKSFGRTEVLKGISFSLEKGEAGMACITKKVMAMTRKIVRNAINRRLTRYERNFAFIFTIQTFEIIRGNICRYGNN